MDLNKKVALITGGTHGIGAEAAMFLAREGMIVCLAARNAGESPVQEQLANNGADFMMIAADISQAPECKRVVAEVLARHGRIDVLVHSAGGAAPGSLLAVSEETWYHAFDVHVHAAFHLCRAAVPAMKEAGAGSIVLISSAAGLRGVRNAIAYAVVKGALPQFTRAMALELADFGIRVNCISPGVIRTRFQDFLTPEQVKNNLDNRIPLHREGTPEDVAEALCMLVKNKFITGENIVIDGGMTMRIV